MKFECYEFNTGVNLTVRRGALRKSDAVDYPPDKILLEGKDRILIGTLVGMQVIGCGLICDSDLIIHHDPECRSYEGLCAKLRAYYPGFDERETVTMVTFEVPHIQEVSDEMTLSQEKNKEA